MAKAVAGGISKAFSRWLHHRLGLLHVHSLVMQLFGSVGYTGPDGR